MGDFYQDFDNLPQSERERFLAELKLILREGDIDRAEIDKQLDNLQNKVDNLPAFVEKTNADFEALTGLTPIDDAFLVFATSLQIVRQILLNKYKDRLSDKEAASKVKNGGEKSNRSQKYFASIEEIKSNPVPFDTIRTEPELKQSDDRPGLSGFNHRYKTLGHDPILGFVFGTTNIMTNTLTKTEGKFGLKTYHVHTALDTAVDKMDSVASTSVMFASVYNRFQEDKKEATKALGLALAKEATHLASDIRTAKSLPLPFLSWISPKASRILNYAGIDSLSIGLVASEAFFAALINWIIATLHSWCYRPDVDKSELAYAARTKKIIQYSNELALLNSTLTTAVRMYLADMSAIKYYDFGGAAITLKETFNAPLEIAKLKHDYLIQQIPSYFKD